MFTNIKYLKYDLNIIDQNLERILIITSIYIYEMFVNLHSPFFVRRKV